MCPLFYEFSNTGLDIPEEQIFPLSVYSLKSSHTFHESITFYVNDVFLLGWDLLEDTLRLSPVTTEENLPFFTRTDFFLFFTSDHFFPSFVQFTMYVVPCTNCTLHFVCKDTLLPQGHCRCWILKDFSCEKSKG